MPATSAGSSTASSVTAWPAGTLDPRRPPRSSSPSPRRAIGFAALDRQAADEVEALLGGLPPDRRAALLAALHEVEGPALNPTPGPGLPAAPAGGRRPRLGRRAPRRALPASTQVKDERFEGFVAGIVSQSWPVTTRPASGPGSPRSTAAGPGSSPAPATTTPPACGCCSSSPRLGAWASAGASSTSACLRRGGRLPPHHPLHLRRPGRRPPPLPARRLHPRRRAPGARLRHHGRRTELVPRPLTTRRRLRAAPGPTAHRGRVGTAVA